MWPSQGCVYTLGALPYTRHIDKQRKLLIALLWSHVTHAKAIVQLNLNVVKPSLHPVPRKYKRLSTPFLMHATLEAATCA